MKRSVYMNAFLFTLTLLLGPLSLSSCGEEGRSFQRIPVTVTGMDNVAEAGAFLFENGAAVPSNINLKTTCSNGNGSVTFYNLVSGHTYDLAVYSPYRSGYDLQKDAKIIITVPSRQNGGTGPILFGKTVFAPKNDKEQTVGCPMERISAELVVELSTSNPAYEGYAVKSITAYANDGAVLSGDGLLDLKDGSLTAAVPGTVSNSVSYVTDGSFILSSAGQTVRLATLPASVKGKPVRMEYVLEKDGKTVTLCHNYPSFPNSLSGGHSVVLNERILEITGNWYYSNYPGLEWEKATPESKGYSSAKLSDLTAYIEKNLSTTSMMVVVDGKVIYEYVRGNRTLADTVRIASCRKSLLSMMYGKYVENGTIDLEATLEDLGIDEDPATTDGVLLPIEKKAKVRHLITARSGVYHMPSNDGDDHAYAPPRGSQEPGTYYLYNNWDFNAAGAILEMKVGKNIYEIFRDDIAIPIGLQDYYLSGQRKSGNASYSKFPAYHFWLSTRDMARIAYLMLNKGMWNGRQVVSEAWVKTTTSVVTPRAEMHPDSRLTKEFDYGYLWWIFCKEFTGYDPNVYGDGYTATGLGGQYFTVLPRLNMVIAHKDETGNMSKSTYYKLIGRVAACRQ
ncbi:MAG: serine hydrolase [Bacteroidales bacterium]|nr:serine hydrolase [Bacteroidales bacterium]